MTTFTIHTPESAPAESKAQLESAMQAGYRRWKTAQDSANRLQYLATP